MIINGALFLLTAGSGAPQPCADFLHCADSGRACSRYLGVSAYRRNTKEMYLLNCPFLSFNFSIPPSLTRHQGHAHLFIIFHQFSPSMWAVPRHVSLSIPPPIRWIAVSLFTTVIGFSMAEICSAYPSAGSVYHWSGQLASPKLGPFASYVTGWLNWLGNAAGDASFAAGWAQVDLSFVQSHLSNSLGPPQKGLGSCFLRP